MSTCPQVAYTLDSANPVPGTTDYFIQNIYGSDLNAAQDTLYVAAIRHPDFDDARIALVDFPSMTTIGLHPGTIQINRAFPFAVGPDGSVYNLREDPSTSPRDSALLEKWSPSGTLIYSVATEPFTFPPTALIYNPVDDFLYGFTDFDNILRLSPATGAFTVIGPPASYAINTNSRPVVTASGEVWLLASHTAPKDTVLRWDGAAWTSFALGFTTIDGLWHGPEANSVAVIDDSAFVWHEVDSGGVVSTICSSIPSDLVSSTVVSDDFSVVLVEGIFHYYAWVTSQNRAGVGRVYIP